MSNIVLDDVQLGRLWNKMLNTFQLKGLHNATLIWKNPTPTTVLAGRTITSLPDLSSFKYFVIE